MSHLRARFGAALARFLASSRNFEVLESVPANSNSTRVTDPALLYVLDSSFNPPTLAHMQIVTSALQETPSVPSRVLLLLATQNADKPSVPASFEDRLVMMSLLAQDLRRELTETLGEPPQVDVGVIKKPYFVDKAAAIEESRQYPASLEQVHLIGYDTLIRIFNTKYYPPTYTLQPLEPFLSKHRLRVTMRPDDQWGGREEQEQYLRDLAQGDRDHEGANREWAQRIQLVPGKPQAGDLPISSTRARQAARAGDNRLRSLVSEGVGRYMMEQKLYREA